MIATHSPDRQTTHRRARRDDRRCLKGCEARRIGTIGEAGGGGEHAGDLQGMTHPEGADAAENLGR